MLSLTACPVPLPPPPLLLQGDYSNYEIQYNMNTKLSAGQKLTVLAGQVLIADH